LSTLGSIEREYTLYEIAILTRAAPAKLLGIPDLGHLGTGAAADITVYRDQGDREAMFTTPSWVFKRGEEIVRDGKVVQVVWGDYHSVQPEYDRGIERELREYYATYQSFRAEHVAISDEEMAAFGHGAGVRVHPLRKGAQ
jgi:formylmethanofuran dehydrogenase subunit A